MSRSDEPLILKRPNAKSLLRRMRFGIRVSAAGTSVLALAWSAAMVWSLFSPEDEPLFFFGAGALFLVLTTFVLHKLAGWGRA